jgi:hypothetical protein
MVAAIVPVMAVVVFPDAYPAPPAPGLPGPAAAVPLAEAEAVALTHVLEALLVTVLVTLLVA